MSALRQVVVVFRKEFVDALRDRRSVLNALLVPVIFVASLGASVGFTGKLMADTQRTLDLPVVGMERAPDLMTFLRENDVLPTAESRVPAELIRSGEAKVALVVPEEYGSALRAGRPAPLQIVYDRAALTAGAQVARVEALLERYSLSLGTLRLIARGVDARIVQPVVLERVDLSTPQSRAATFLLMIPMFLLLTIFASTLAISTDSTAGERERGSLEPLLINPVPRWALVAGKLAATVTFALGALALVLAGLMLLPSFVSFTALGGDFALRPLAAFGLLFPLVVTLCSVQMLVASFARSFKEAQSTLALLNFAVVLTAAVLFLLPPVPKLWVFAIPMISEEVLLSRMLRGEVLEPLHVVVSMASGVAWAAVAVSAVIYLYRSEKLLFGK